MNKYVKRYLIDALGGMAQGLFASLLVGTIVKTLGELLLKLGQNPVSQFLVDAGAFAGNPAVVGAAMAIAIGYALKAPALVFFHWQRWEPQAISLARQADHWLFW